MEFRVLGPVELWLDDQKVELGRAKERCLLGVLLLSTGRPVTTRTLLEALWDDAPPEQARKSIQAYVSRLRRVLRQVGSAARITTQHDSYTLHAGGDEVDYLRFKMLLNQGRALRRQHQLDTSAHLLSEATALWVGPAIAELRTGWIERRREDLEGYDRLAVYQELCDVQLERGNYQDVLQLLDEAMQGHELDTKYISQRLTALDGAGQYPEFDAYWKRIYRQTVEAFGTGPGRDLLDLHGRLLQKRDGLVAWQHTHPALAEVRRPPAQLPATINDFVGRKDDLARLDQVLMRSRLNDPTGTLVLAVTGPVGVGKSELALRWAHGVKEQFPYGQLYVDLAGYSADKPAQPVEVLAEFLAALGVRQAEIPGGITARSALFRTILDDRDTLLFLDNARDSEQVRHLLPGSGKCVVIVTSRHRLTDLVTRHGAYRSPLTPLGAEESAQLIQGALIRAGLRPNTPLLDSLVELSDGLPQLARNAIDLIIRRLDVTTGGRELSSSDIPTMIAILDHGEGAEQSLRSSLAWSFRALPDGAARMACALGKCPCVNLSKDALAAFTKSLSPRFSLDLDGLISLHLVRFNNSRYTVHELYRTFCSEHGSEFLTDSDFLKSMIGLLAWYEDGIRHASAILFGRRAKSPPEPDWFTDRTAAGVWLANELSNLVALVRFSVSHSLPSAWTISALLRDYLDVRRLFSEWNTIHQSGLMAAKKLNAVDAKIDMLNGLAIAARRAGHFNEGLRHIQQALEAQNASTKNSTKAESLRIRASLHRDLGQGAEAYSDYKAAVSLVESEDRQQLADILYELSLVCADLGRLGETSAALWRSLAIQNELGDLVGKSATMTQLALLCRRTRKDDEAMEFCTRVLELRHNEVLGYADSLLAFVILAEISCDSHDFESGLNYSRQALTLCHTPQDHQLAARAMISLVTALIGLGRRDQARAEAGHALALIGEIDSGKAAVVREQFESLGALSL